ncbi:hypothetical protein RB195_014925 [Necator americanus]|uniref:Uncharacterized protein n=1 Tax=Necator americanus TaxID=51031 RepID=A0ABR1E3Y9_NECAM
MVVVAEIVVKNGACSVLSDVIFVFGATKTDEQKEDTPLDEENVVQNRLGIACYLHMEKGEKVAARLKRTTYNSTGKVESRVSHCIRMQSQIMSAYSDGINLTAIGQQKELGKFQSEYYFDLIMSPGLIGFRAYAAIRNHDNEVMVNEFDQDVMQLEIAEAESGDKNVAVDAH